MGMSITSERGVRAARSPHQALLDKSKAAELALSQQIVPGSYQKYMPRVDDYLVVLMPGETMRCPVKKIISEDAVLFHTDTVPMAKSHSFEFDKMYGARRRVRNGRDVWEAQKDRDFLEEQTRILGAIETVKPKKRLPPEALKPVAPVKTAVAPKKRKFER